MSRLPVITVLPAETIFPDELFGIKNKQEVSVLMNISICI